MNTNENSYTAEDIQVLEGLEAVRKRPGMYIGSTGQTGLHHLVTELVDNSIDEVSAGYGDTIDVIIDTDNSVWVSDNGRGIPVDTHAKTGKSALELVMTTLHSGGKFDSREKVGYQTAGGLHGVGASCVNALSEWLVATVKKDNILYYQKYERGAPVSKVETRETVTDDGDNHTGTIMHFMPDDEIFDALIFDGEKLKERLRELAYLNKGVRITFKDKNIDEEAVHEFKYEGGLVSFIDYYNLNKEVLHDHVISLEGKLDGTSIEIALQFNTSYTENLYSYANNIRTTEGGFHETGFKTAFTRVFNTYAKDNKLLKNTKITLTGEDIREGLLVIISVKVPEPQFEGQTKSKLGNTEVEGIVQTLVSTELKSFLEENPSFARKVIQKSLQSAEARLAARKAREVIRRKNILDTASMPGKLVDCSSRNRDETELFLVEGDSAGGTAKQGRSREFQAVLPLKGKGINVEKSRLDKILKNEQVMNIITALGTGIGTEDSSIDKLRYGKIIIMADADVDGAHIRTLLLTFFFRQMPYLIVEGKLFIAQPPLFRVNKGKHAEYLQTEKELRSFLLNSAEELVTVRNIEKREEPYSTVQLRRILTSLSQLESLLQDLIIKGFDHQEIFDALTIGLKLYKIQDASGSWFEFGEDETEIEYSLFNQKAGEQMSLLATQDDDSYHQIEEVSDIQYLALMRDEIQALLKYDIDYISSYGQKGKNLFEITDKNDVSVEVENLQSCLNIIQTHGSKNINILRYKGLAEMNADQLKETTMDVNSRVLLEVTLDNALQAERMFSLLMGDVVEPRRKFIEKYAKHVSLDRYGD